MAPKTSPPFPADESPHPTPARGADSSIIFCELAIIVATLAAYHNSFSAPFVFQDLPDIVDNPTIRHLGDLGAVLSPPSASGLTVGGRPLVNLTLAINYALGGTRVWGYHAFNLLIHVLAALALFGVVRRTLAGIAKSGVGCHSMERYGPPAPSGKADPSAEALAKAERLRFNAGWAGPVGFAFGVALLWSLHPLQTESVTYVVQRAEAMMGLFYLLTLYCFIRYVEGDGGRAGPLGPPVGPGPSLLRRGFGGQNRQSAEASAKAGGPALPRTSWLSSGVWAGLSILFCLLGMATKEVMVSAPVIVFFYDRTFVSGSFARAWRRRKGVYLGLGCTWILLAVLVIGAGERGGTAGFGIGVSWWSYLQTQFPAVLHYLRLAAWPHPLIFDYGAQWVANGWKVVPAAVVGLGLATGSAYLLFRGAEVASVTPYLRSGHAEEATGPVQALGWLGFFGLWFFAILAPTSLVPGASQTMAEHRMYLALAPVVVLGAWGIGAGCGWIVHPRRTDHPRRGNTEVGTPKPWPRGAIAPRLALVLLALSLGLVTAQRNRDYRSNFALWADTALKRPGHARAYANLGNALFDSGRLREAIAQYQRALRVDPASPEAHNGLGNAWLDLGRLREAAGQFEQALQARPSYPEAHNNLGSVLFRLGEIAPAVHQLQIALQLRPEYADAHYNLGLALAFAGQMPQAIGQFEQAVSLAPDKADIRNNLAAALAGSGRFAEAIAVYRKVLGLNPNYAEAHNNLANALAETGRLPEAISEYEAALRLKPDYSKAHSNLGLALANTGRLPEAIEQYRAALRLEPDFADAHYNLALALRALGQNDEAKNQFEAAARLQGNQSGKPP